MPQMMDDSGRVCQSFGRMNEASFSLPSSMLTRWMLALIMYYKLCAGILLNPKPPTQIFLPSTSRIHHTNPSLCKASHCPSKQLPGCSNCACNYGFKTCCPRFRLCPVSRDISLRAVLRSSAVIANAKDSRLSCPNRPIIGGCKSNREQQQATKHDRHDRKHPFPHLNPPSY